MINLVGHTVRISPQDKEKGGNKTRTIKIIYEYMDDKNVRWYNVQEIETNKV